MVVTFLFLFTHDFMFVKDTIYEGEHWLSTKQFGKDTYYLWATIESNKAYFSLSSGNKRKHKFVFEEKSRKSTGGVAALIWARDEMLSFNEVDIKMLCVQASDSRRRRIYKRGLNRFGFGEQRIKGDLVLIKKYERKR